MQYELGQAIKEKEGSPSRENTKGGGVCLSLGDALDLLGSDS